MPPGSGAHSRRNPATTNRIVGKQELAMPEFNRFPDHRFEEHPSSTGLWLIGALIVLVLAGGLYYVWSGTTNTASTAATGLSGPATTSGSATTGSGSNIKR
jgi:hypothetical protein